MLTLLPLCQQTTLILAVRVERTFAGTSKLRPSSLKAPELAQHSVRRAEPELLLEARLAITVEEGILS